MKKSIAFFLFSNAFKHTIILLIVGTTFISCRHVRIVSLIPEDLSSNVSDSVYVTYDYWSESNNFFKITIHNKSSKPIYVDWNKCRLFINSTARRYWIDQTKKRAVGIAGKHPVYNVVIGVGAGTTIKPEKVTFVVPYSNVSVRWEALPAFEHELINLDTAMEDCSYCRKDKKVKVYKKKMTPEYTLLQIRNFISYSFTEDFKEEKHIDDYWYANQITIMRLRQYRGRKRFFERRFEYPYRNKNSYFYRFL